MANRKLPMRKIKEVLRLKYVCGLSEREIALSCWVTRSLVINAVNFRLPRDSFDYHRPTHKLKLKNWR